MSARSGEVVERGLGDRPPDPRVLAFVEGLAALYADLWHSGKLDDMVEDSHAPQSEAE